MDQWHQEERDCISIMIPLPLAPTAFMQGGTTWVKVAHPCYSLCKLSVFNKFLQIIFLPQGMPEILFLERLHCLHMKDKVHTSGSWLLAIEVENIVIHLLHCTSITFPISFKMVSLAFLMQNIVVAIYFAGLSRTCQNTSRCIQRPEVNVFGILLFIWPKSSLNSNGYCRCPPFLLFPACSETCQSRYQFEVVSNQVCLSTSSSQDVSIRVFFAVENDRTCLEENCVVLSLISSHTFTGSCKFCD